MYILKGYETLSVAQVANIFCAVIRNVSQMFEPFRVLCAWLYLDAKDEATRRTLAKQGQFVGEKRYPSVREIKAIVGERISIRPAWKKLVDAGVLVKDSDVIILTETPLDFTRPLLEIICGSDDSGNLKRKPSRRVPIPHEWLFQWASTPCRAKCVPVLHFFYTAVWLSFKTKSKSIVGTCACFHLTKLISAMKTLAAPQGFSSDEDESRAYDKWKHRVQRARRQLINERRISDDSTIYEWKRKRDGLYVELYLDWMRDAAENLAQTGYRDLKEEPGKTPLKCPNETETNTPKCPAPLRDHKPITLVKETTNQQPSANVTAKPYAPDTLPKAKSGVSKQTTLREVNPNRVRYEDLILEDRFIKYFQRQNRVEHTESDFRLLCCVRERALTTIFSPDAPKGKQNHPLKVFCGIVNRKLWDNISKKNDQAGNSFASLLLRHYGHGILRRTYANRLMPADSEETGLNENESKLLNALTGAHMPGAPSDCQNAQEPRRAKSTSAEIQQALAKERRRIHQNSNINSENAAYYNWVLDLVDAAKNVA